MPNVCASNPVLSSGVLSGTVRANPCIQGLKNVLSLFMLMCKHTYVCSDTRAIFIHMHKQSLFVLMCIHIYLRLETRAVYVHMHKHTVYSSTGPVQPYKNDLEKGALLIRNDSVAAFQCALKGKVQPRIGHEDLEGE